MKLGVFILSVILLMSGCSSSGDNDAGDTDGGSGAVKVNTSAIELPAELAGLRDRPDAVKAKSGDRGAKADRERVQKSIALTKKWYDRAFGGAGFGMRVYADDDLTFFPTVIAVRAPSPGLVAGPIFDPKVMKIEAGPNVPEYVESDGVECVQYSSMTVVEGKSVDPDDIVTSLCAISDDTHSVYVYGIAGGKDNQAKGIALAKAAFDAID
ncbi:MAG: hypothetical protein ACSLFF_03555 [Solirubrobacterales bacterium]